MQAANRPVFSSLDATVLSAARRQDRPIGRVWEMSRDLFAVIGFDGRLKAINPAWETTLGCDTETLLSLSFREQVHPDDHRSVQAVMERLLRGETVLTHRRGRGAHAGAFPLSS
ncbi:MAG TPA: PAS domain S-box protein [Allosphingosinicella sp.]